MYFGAGTAKLNHAMKSLHEAWDRSEDDWRDSMRDDFRRDSIEPVLEESAKALRAMDNLADLFARIYRDCS